MHSQYMDPLGGSADQLARFMRDELKAWTPIIARSGATID